MEKKRQAESLWKAEGVLTPALEIQILPDVDVRSFARVVKFFRRPLARLLPSARPTGGPNGKTVSSFIQCNTLRALNVPGAYIKVIFMFGSTAHHLQRFRNIFIYLKMFHVLKGYNHRTDCV